jgi:hypothetical protein
MTPPLRASFFNGFVGLEARMVVEGAAVRVCEGDGASRHLAEGCDEATVLGICSSADESLMESLMSLHGDAAAPTAPQPAKKLVRPASKSRKR